MIDQLVRELLAEQNEVRGYVKPDSAFFTLAQWEEFVHRMLHLQKLGQDTRGNGANMSEEVNRLVMQHFAFQLQVEVPRYDLLTQKNVYDFVEDFVNHRFWSFQRDFGHFFPDASRPVSYTHLRAHET